MKVKCCIKHVRGTYTPKTIDCIKALQTIGINPLDNNGNFRPFNFIMTELGEVLYKQRSGARTKNDILYFKMLQMYMLNRCASIRYASQFMY